MVGDVAHRVDVFLGRAGGNQYVLTGQGQMLEALGGTQRQVRGFEHAPQADVATGLAAGGRAEDLDATALQELGGVYELKLALSQAVMESSYGKQLEKFWISRSRSQQQIFIDSMIDAGGINE